MPPTTDDCKKAITNLCTGNRAKLDTQFVAPLSDEMFAAALDVKNWKREAKRRTREGLTVRDFDCRPFDSQLRAYVVSNETGILRVTVQGE